MRMLDARGEYFDQRTGNTWDLFFPGYYKSDNFKEVEVGARPAGHDFGASWYFNASEFNALRARVERASAGRWSYSGEVDLVLVNGLLVQDGKPVIDWASTISGPITDPSTGTRTLTLAGVVELVTRDFESAAEDASYGVGEVTDGPTPIQGHGGRDFTLNALAGIAAALGTRAVGL